METTLITPLLLHRVFYGEDKLSEKQKRELSEFDNSWNPKGTQYGNRSGDSCGMGCRNHPDSGRK